MAQLAALLQQTTLAGGAGYAGAVVADGQGAFAVGDAAGPPPGTRLVAGISEIFPAGGGGAFPGGAAPWAASAPGGPAPAGLGEFGARAGAPGAAPAPTASSGGQPGVPEYRLAEAGSQVRQQAKQVAEQLAAFASARGQGPPPTLPPGQIERLVGCVIESCPPARARAPMGKGGAFRSKKRWS